jgi:CheY-like chemotaxis protein
VKNHGGYMTAKSILGKGSRFLFYLPASAAVASDTPAEEERLRPGSFRVLVMDDDEIVRTVVERLLKNNGYRVVSTTDGRGAIEAYRKASEEGAPFDIVIMDLTVPGGLGGKEAVQRILDYDSEAKVIVFSGYSNDPVLANYKEYGFSGVIAKPFSIDEFSRVLNRIMHS